MDGTAPDPIFASPRDELAVGALVTRLAMAADDRDPVAYRACLADRVDIAAPGEPPIRVDAETYARDAIARVANMDWTHHRPGPPLLLSAGDRDRMRASVDIAVVFGWTEADGSTWQCRTGGRYHLGLVRRQGLWRICARHAVWRYRDRGPGTPP